VWLAYGNIYNNVQNNLVFQRIMWINSIYISANERSMECIFLGCRSIALKPTEVPALSLFTNINEDNYEKRRSAEEAY